LRLALIIFLFFQRLLYFFYEIAFAIAMQPWLVPVFAKFGRDIIPVQFKTCINKQAGKVDRNQRDDQ
jgi:hypothetical protein